MVPAGDAAAEGAVVMAGYTYRLPSRYRWRRYGRRSDKNTLAVAAVLVALLAATGTAKATHHAATPAQGAAAGTAAAQAIAYGRQQLGKPYLWGGTGPDAYDCSGLVMEAYASAGITIPRTSEAQWAGLPHVSSPQPGDLVFAPGSDGTWASPGHVALVIPGGQVIQAYATGTPIEVSSLSEFASGAGGIVGYARP
jgi:cell wall-associated NlpC family hydrolase